MYTKSDLGIALKNELNKGYDVDRIADWAFNLNIKLRENKSSDVTNVLEYLEIMEAGPEFVFSEIDLIYISNMLIEGESDPIKCILEKRCRNS